MATATTSSVKPDVEDKSDKSDHKSDDKSEKRISGTAKLDERFKFGPPPIQTAEDATMAYLREEITEDEYRTALGKFGILPGQIMKTSGERVDTPFERSIPDDIYDPEPHTKDTLELRLQGVEEAEKRRKEAVEDAEKNPPALKAGDKLVVENSAGSTGDPKPAGDPIPTQDDKTHK